MAQLRTLAALSGNPHSIPSTHMVMDHRHLQLPGLFGHLTHKWYTDIQAGKTLKTNKVRNKDCQINL